MNFCGLFKAKAILVEKHSWKDKEVHTFFKSIGSKVNVTARLKFELTYNDVTVQHVSDYTIGTHPHLINSTNC